MNTTINQKFNEELMALIGKEEKEEEVCLIDGTQLKDQFIELKCSHKFNYISILNEIKVQRKYNNLETQKLNPYHPHYYFSNLTQFSPAGFFLFYYISI